MISRLIARRASSFRKQYGFRFVRQTNIALCRWKELNIVETMNNIYEGISLYKIDGGFNIPTNVNFEYLLVRLQCAGKILSRAISCAKQAFNIFLGFIEKAFFIDTTAVYLGVLSKIWKNSIELCQKIVNFYGEIVSILKPLLSSNSNASDINEKYPDRLDEWLGDEWNEINVQTKCNRKRKHHNVNNFSFDIADFNSSDVSQAIKVGQAVNDHDKTVNVVAATTNRQLLQIEKPQTKLRMNDLQSLNVKKAKLSVAPPSNKSSASIADNFDLGEALCRDTLQSKEIPQIQELPKIQQIDINRIRTLKDLHAFIGGEEAMRNCGQHEISKRINNDEWRRFKLKINRMIETMEPWLCVKKFKGVWRALIDN